MWTYGPATVFTNFLNMVSADFSNARWSIVNVWSICFKYMNDRRALAPMCLWAVNLLLFLADECIYGERVVL